MKATFDRKSLLEAFLTAASVAPSRSPKPILQNIKLSIEDGQASLMATDLEVAIHRTLRDVMVSEDGHAILPTVRFGQILRTSNADQIDIETDGDKMHIKADRSRFSLPNEDPALFPVLPAFSSQNYMVMLGADLKRMIKRTAFAVDLDGSRYALGGAFVERGDDAVSFVCTDGRRLAKATTSAEWVGEVDGSAQCIIPSKAMKLLDKAIDDDGDQIHFGVEPGTSAMFRTSDSVITTRLVEGRFPRYADVFPAEPRFTVPLDVTTFRSAIEQASIVTSEESRGVTFKFSNDGVELTSEAADAGHSRVELPLFGGMDGACDPIAMDPRFVTECLRTLEPGTPLTADLVDGATAVVLRSGEDYLYVVMPLTK